MTNIKAKPFFSALLDPRVEFISEANTWKNTFYTAINRIFSYVGMHHVYPQSLQRKKLFLSQAEGLLPPVAPHPMLKVRTKMTFNHVFSFLKHQGHIWYALRKSEQQAPVWKLFYIDGLDITREKFEQAEMIADGENFMLRVPGDDSDNVYYKKVIDEKRNGDRHIITNLCEEPGAIDSWFTLPILHRLKPLQTGKRLSIAKNAKWAMSNAAEYKFEIIDERGIKHPHLPITIVYEHHKGLVELHDPYVEKESTYKVSLPYPSKENEIIEASASVLLVSSKIDQNGKTQPFLYSHYLDYDSEGLHPLIPVTLDHQDIKKRLLPINQTTVHRLPVGLQEITHLSVLQSQHSPHALEIRVASKNKPHGFYFKDLKEESWRFYEPQTGIVRDNLRHAAIIPNPKPTIHQAHQTFSFQGQTVTQVKMTNFNEHGTFCSVEFMVNGQSKHLILRRHKNLIKSFIGHESISWTLNPSPKHPHASFLSGKLAIPVMVSIAGNKVLLESKDPNNLFSLCLTNSDSYQNTLIFTKVKTEPKALLNGSKTLTQRTRLGRQ